MSKDYILPGAGPDAELDGTSAGRQSKVPYRFDLLPPLATASVAYVLDHGAKKYGEWNWLLIPPAPHLNHALQHVVAYQLGDKQEGDLIEHARHAVCRMMFWLEQLEREKQDANRASAAELPDNVRKLCDDGFCDGLCDGEF